MATTLLHHHDSLLLAFDATVAEHGRFSDKPSVVLDATAFYAEAGGQMADRGVLDGRPVLDVQVDELGRVHHMLDAPAEALPAVGARVHGAVEAQRRRQFMALHSAQHMLSRAVLDEAGAETVSSRLGESVCTIDLDVPALAEAKLARAEDTVNAVIDADVAVRAFFPSPEDLRALPLRRQPKVAENVRVIDVQGFDVSPCGGTHVTHTAQVGLVRVTGVERYKGMVRVSFQAGPRARTEVFARARALEAMARELSAQPADVPDALAKLRDQLKLQRDERAALVERYAALLASSLTASDGRVVASLELGGVELLRALAPLLLARGLDALLAAPGPEGVQVLLARAPASSLDCGALLKALAAATGGRGGGKPDRAEGRLPVGAAFVELVSAHLP